MKTFLITEKFQRCLCDSIKEKSPKFIEQNYSVFLEIGGLLRDVEIPDDLVGEFICRNFMDLSEYMSGTLLKPSNWHKHPQSERFLVDLTAARWREDWICFYSLYEPVLDKILYWAFKQEVVNFNVERNHVVYGNFERARIGGKRKDEKRSSLRNFFGKKKKESRKVLKCIVGQGQDKDQTCSEDSEDDLVWQESPLPKPVVRRAQEELELQAKLAEEERKAVEDMKEFNDIGKMVFGKSQFYVERSRNRPARPPFTFRKEAFQSSVEEQEALKKLKETELEQKLQAKLADEERKAVETMGRFNDIGRMVLGKSTSFIERRGSHLILPFSRIGQSFLEKMNDREREALRRSEEDRGRRRMDVQDRDVSFKLARAKFENNQVTSTLVTPEALEKPSVVVGDSEDVTESLKKMEKDLIQGKAEEHYEYEVRLIMDVHDSDDEKDLETSFEGSAPPGPTNLQDNESLRFADSSDSSDSSDGNEDLAEYLEPEETLEYLTKGYVVRDEEGEKNKEAGNMGSSTLSEEAEEENQKSEQIHVDSEVEEDQNQNPHPPESQREDDITLAIEKLNLEFQHRLAVQKQKHQAELQLLQLKRLMLKEEMEIRMKGRTSRSARIQEILFQNPIILFSRTLEVEKTNIVVNILNAKSVPFHHFPVDDDVEIRLGIKEFTGKEEFPQLLINGKLVEIKELEEFLDTFC